MASIGQLRKKEEALRKGKILHKVDISTAFTQTISTDMISICWFLLSTWI